MFKPPKRVTGITAPDIPANIAGTSNRLPGASLITTESSAGLPSAPALQPSVQVNEIPAPSSPSVEAALQSITWPADQVHLLQRLGTESGLFISPDGKLYAHVENEGHLLAEHLRDGRYQIPFPFTPHLPGPFLVKAERQPLWTFERPAWMTQHSESDRRNAAADGPAVEQPIYLAPDDAALLSSPLYTAEGIRYDKHRKTYIDTEQGTVMVRKNADGQYEQTSATTRNASRLLFEQIPGTRLWRRKFADDHPDAQSSTGEPGIVVTDMPEATAGPSKRPHADEGAETTHALTESLLSANPEPINLSFGLWRNWGRSFRPQLGQHIEIDGQFYRIVPQQLGPDPHLVYLQHPLFSPALYDAFEYMLRDNPSLQPKFAVKRAEHWTVLDDVVPFEMPITQYISRTFKYLSDLSVSSLARAMFNQANRSEIIIGPGLATLNRVFRYWENRGLRKAPRRELADPMLMLRSQSETADTLAIPFALGEGLMRLDFDPGRFSRHWNEYAAARTTPGLHRLFGRLLGDDGYEVTATAQPLGDDALLFHRKNIDQVFVLRLPPLINGRLKRVTPESFAFSDSQLRTVITEQKPLSTFREENKVIYLLGGTQTDVLGQTTLFVIRDQ
jgi:hypothetical protein